MVKGWPDSVLTRVHSLLTLAFSDPTPKWLQWGWLCPKPKDPANGITLNSLRRLMLLEVLRKLWIWIYIRKIVHLWESHQTLTHSQHGFRRGHGTDSALMVHLNCIEHARLTSAPLFLSSWDIRRAFDSLTNESFGCKLAPVGRTSGHCPLDCSPRRPMPYCSSVPVGLGSLKSGGICRSTRRPFRDAPWYFCPGTGHPTG